MPISTAFVTSRCPVYPSKPEWRFESLESSKLPIKSHSEIGGGPFSKGPQTLRCILHI